MAKSSSKAQNIAENKALYLGGTVCCPDLFPNLAILSIESVNDEKVLRIAEQRHTVQVIRSVKLRDVAAVFVPKDPGSPDLSELTWLFGIKAIGKSFEKLCGKQKSSLGKTKAYGLAYVPEGCPISVCILAALTASQSEDFVAKAEGTYTCHG